MAPAMRNGRCKMHGGKSTGPRTPEGLESLRQANLVHGRYTAEALTIRRDLAQFITDSRNLLKASLRHPEELREGN